MSRIGKQPIAIPANTQVTVSDSTVSVKGPKGELSKKYASSAISVVVEGTEVIIAPLKETRESKSLWGTTAAHIKNMVKGVNEPYTKRLILFGVGYKAEVKATNLVMALGFSHPVIVEIPKGLTVTTDKEGITVVGPDKEMVGQFSATVRSLKKPEPYKGKGFHYSDETILRKQGKKASA
jgi:large subunit ribosomal protein L6